jgi:carbon monoxide dehydrogenase subunit G
MARIEESVQIKRPADKVFAYMADVKTWPRWDSGFLEAEQTSPGQMGIGTTLRGALKAMGRRMTMTVKVTEYEPNKKFGGTVDFGSMLLEEHFIFDSIEGATKLTRVYDVQLGGLLKILAPMVLSSMRSGSKKSLSNLKSLLEAQT